MEEKKLSQLSDEKLDAVSGGGKNPTRGKIDMNRLVSGPTRYCPHCQKYVTSKMTYNNRYFCPECEKEI